MDIITQLKRDEGEILHVYLDSRGIRTAGVGHNLESHGINLMVGAPISQDLCDAWLTEDISAAEAQLHAYLPWTDGLDEVRKAVLINMAFNMGIHGLLGFKNTLAMVESGDYAGAAHGMLASAWAGQVGPRAERLAEQMESGLWV